MIAFDGHKFEARPLVAAKHKFIKISLRFGGFLFMLTLTFYCIYAKIYVSLKFHNFLDAPD